jgi:hypothetical protein
MNQQPPKEMNDTPTTPARKPMAMLETPTELRGFPLNPNPGPMPSYEARWKAIDASRRFKRRPDGTAIVPGGRPA